MKRHTGWVVGTVEVPVTDGVSFVCTVLSTPGEER